MRDRIGSLSGMTWAATEASTPMYAMISNNLMEYALVVAGVPASSKKGMGLSAWGNGFGIFGDQDGDFEHFGFDYRTGGAVIGADYRLTDNMVVGLSGGAAHSKADYDRVSSGTTAHSYFGGLYGAYAGERFFIDALLSWIHHRYDTYRDITFAGRRASSDHNANEFSAFLGGGYKFTLGGFNLIPGASLQYSYFNEDSFTEHGADSLNLRVSDFDSHSFLTRLGFRFNRAFQMGDVRLVPEVKAEWAHEFGESDRPVTARFTGGNAGTFTVKGYEPSRDSALLGASISACLYDNYAFFVNYDAELKKDFHAHGIMGGIRVFF